MPLGKGEHYARAESHLRAYASATATENRSVAEACMKKKTMINKEQLAALIKAVEEGGDDDDEITEDEAIAILRDTGLDAEIPSVREWFAWERSQKRPQ